MGKDPLRDIEARFDDLRRALQAYTPLGPRREANPRAPAVDLVDEEREIVVTADVPGMTRDDIDVAVHTRSVTITAHHKEEEKTLAEGFVRRERNARAYERQLDLPHAVEPDNATATVQNGVLTIHLPKRAPDDERARHITPD